ncbi:Uncharacterized protein OBRU01_16966, partial [Operophtera brumata]
MGIPNLLLYYDDDTQWPAVYRSTKRYRRRRLNAESNRNGPSNGKERLIVSCHNSRRFRSARERWWFIAITIVVCSVELKSRHLLHSTYKLYCASACYQHAGVLLQSLAYVRYATHGRGGEGAKVTGQFFCGISEMSFLLLLVLLAKGYTVTRGRLKLGFTVRLTVFMCCYFVTYIVLFAFDPGEVLYLYESPAGYGIVVLRMAAWCVFARTEELIGNMYSQYMATAPPLSLENDTPKLNGVPRRIDSISPRNGLINQDSTETNQSDDIKPTLQKQNEIFTVESQISKMENSLPVAKVLPVEKNHPQNGELAQIGGVSRSELPVLRSRRNLLEPLKREEVPVPSWSLAKGPCVVGMLKKSKNIKEDPPEEHTQLNGKKVPPVRNGVRQKSGEISTILEGR